MPSRLAAVGDIQQFLPPRISWDEFRGRFEWNQGEHVGLIGPTGAGKSTLAISLLDYRKYVAAFITKPVDATMDALGLRGYIREDDWSKFKPPNFQPKRLLWPNARVLNSKEIQKDKFLDAMEDIYVEGKWCMYWDELWYMINQLGFTMECKTFLMQARSLKISFMMCTQRPAGVPVEVYDQSTHLFFWCDNDERNLQRLGGISWANADIVRMAIATLDRYEVLYVNTREGLDSMVRFFPPGPKALRKALGES